MAIEFQEEFNVIPIPVTPRQSAIQATVVRKQVEKAGNLDTAIKKTIEAIQKGQTDPPSELGRLRELYARAYTTKELQSLVINTFKELGIESEGD